MVCWFVLGEHVSSQRNGNEFFGFIKNFFLNEEVNEDFNTVDLLINIIEKICCKKISHRDGVSVLILLYLVKKFVNPQSDQFHRFSGTGHFKTYQVFSIR